MSVCKREEKEKKKKDLIQSGPSNSTGPWSKMTYEPRDRRPRIGKILDIDATMVCLRHGSKAMGNSRGWSKEKEGLIANTAYIVSYIIVGGMARSCMYLSSTWQREVDV